MARQISGLRRGRGRPRRLGCEPLESRRLLTLSGQIGGLVFYDGDGDGHPDANEVGLAGWTLFLDDNDNQTIDANERSTVSDAQGRFTFTNVPPGQHLVRQVEQAGWVRTVPFADVYTLEITDTVEGRFVDGLLFGNQIANDDLYATLSGVKWNDLNHDGVRDPNEPGLAGWQIYLDLNNNSQWDAFESSTFTNAAGRYAFDRLPPGTYVVREVQQGGWQQSFPGGGSHTAHLSTGQVIDPLNFGNFVSQPGSLTGTKWRDLDQDGVRDTNDRPISGVEFFVDQNGNGAWDVGEPVSVSNAQGIFQFLGIAPGTYAVGEVLPPGWTQTTPGLSHGFTAAGAYDLPDLPDPTTQHVPAGQFATGDLDGDGDLDVAAATRQGVTLLFNDGNGQLAARRDLVLPAMSLATGSLALSDVNEDGRLDLIAGGREATTGPALSLFTFLNGIGGFNAVPVSTALSLTPDFLEPGDFNADGHADLVAGARDGQLLSLFLGDGQGALVETPMPSLSVPANLGLSGLVAADFDQDGRTDLAAIGSNLLVVGPLAPGIFQAWQSLATGGFSAAAPLNLPGPVRDVFARNLRGDAIPELLALVETGGPNGWTTSLQELSLASWQATLGGAWQVHAGADLTKARTPAIDAADFDGDGLNDVAVLDEAGRAIWILQGRANGSFDSPRAVPLGDKPLALAAALLNGDSAPDLAVLNEFSSSVSTLLNDGRGSFPRVDRFDTLQQLDEVTPVDIDSDGDLDLVGFDRAGGRLLVAVNRGQGRFESPRVFALESNLAAALIGDVDGNGQVDLVTIANAQTAAGAAVFRVVARLNLGAAGLISLPAIAAIHEFPGHATAGSLADVNRDDVLDLVVTYGGFAQDPALERLILQGGGDGSFMTLADSVLRPRASGQELLVDLDGDGDLDRVRLQAADNTLSLERNLGGGNFAAPVFFAVGQSPQYAVAADFDSDQDLDLLVANAASANLSLWLNDGAGALSPAPAINVGGHPVSLAAVDFDVDGLKDIAVVDDSINGVRILRGTGSNTFGLRGTWNVGDGPSSIVTGDWNHDGLPDLATVNTLGDSLTVLLQSAGISFTANTLAAGSAPGQIATGYLDADSFLDLYVTREVAGHPQLFEFLNNGLGDCSAPAPLTIDRTTRDATLADVTGDQHLDLIVVDDFDRSLLVFPGQGNGYFQSPLTTMLDARPHFVRTLDANRDGDLDLSIGWLDRAGIGLLLNDGLASFTPGLDYPLTTPPEPYWTGDLDDDGQSDYVIPDRAGGFYHFARGWGDGTFAPALSMAGELPGSVGVGDLDGDGNLDVLGSLLGQQFAVYWNQTRPDHQYQVTVLPGQAYTGPTFGNYRPSAPWQNPYTAFDVNDDTFVSAIDALQLINRLNAGHGGLLPPVAAGQQPPPYYDPSGDNFLAPNDVLQVINFLNLTSQGGGEGEASNELTLGAAPSVNASGSPAQAASEVAMSANAPAGSSIAPGSEFAATGGSVSAAPLFALAAPLPAPAVLAATPTTGDEDSRVSAAKQARSAQRIHWLLALERFFADLATDD